MRKIKEFFLSKTFLLTIIIAIQIASFFVLYYAFSAKTPYVKIALNVIGIILFFSLINSDAPASNILPWAVVIMFSPIIGVTFYAAFGRKYIRKSDVKKYKLIEKYDHHKALSDDEVSTKSIYLKNASNFKAYKNTKTTYLPTGEEFFKCLLEKIEGAEKYIFLEYFIIDNGKMWDQLHEALSKKLKQGVEIKIIYDSFGSGTKVPHNFYKKLIKEGFDCRPFHKLVPIATPLHNNRDHRKITIIDGKTAFIGGTNIADEYINLIHPYGNWRDNNLLVEGEAVNNFVVMFIEQYNSSTKQRILLDYPSYCNEDNSVESDEIVQPFASGPNPLYQPRLSEIHYLNIINQAKDYVYITSPYFVVDTYFIDALISAVKRNVDVRIMLPGIPDGFILDTMAKSNYKKLILSGIKIFEYKDGFIHSKSIVADDNCATIGTINFDYRSFIHHFECGVYLENSPTIAKMKDDYLCLCENQCELIPLKKANMNIFKKLVRNFLKIFSPLF